MDYLKRNWLQLATLALCAALLVTVVRQGERIDALNNTVSGITSSLSSQINDVSNRVASGVEEANRLTGDYELTASGMDSATHSLLLDVSLSVKTYQKDSAVTFVTKLGGGAEQKTPLTLTDTGRFAGQLALPLDEPVGSDLTAAVVMDTDGVVTRESVVGGWSLPGLLPVQSDWPGSVGYGYDEGNLTLHPHPTQVYGPDGGAVTVTAPEFRLYCNGALDSTRAAEPEARPDGMQYSWPDESGTGWLAAAAEGDEFRLVFACTDEMGLGYEFPVVCLLIQNGDAVEQWDDSFQGPTLYWND